MRSYVHFALLQLAVHGHRKPKEARALWRTLSKEDRDGTNDLVEVPSATDKLPDLKARMQDTQRQLGSPGSSSIVPTDPKLVPQ